MRITVKTSKKENEREYRFTILLPTSVVFSRLTARIIAKHSPSDSGIDPQLLASFIVAARPILKRYRRLCIVDIRSSDGDVVKIVV